MMTCVHKAVFPHLKNFFTISRRKHHYIGTRIHVIVKSSNRGMFSKLFWYDMMIFDNTLIIETPTYLEHFACN